MSTTNLGEKKTKIVAVVLVLSAIMFVPPFNEEMFNGLSCLIHEHPLPIRCQNATSYFVIGQFWGSSIPWSNIEIFKPDISVLHKWFPGFGR